mmetsp:Transcript_27373/g.58391  ORF Transcript_27373/g.58391 Transcript_27373/m.58391 type:complete len:156 (-) Transcript_27373:317-784(-)
MAAQPEQVLEQGRVSNGGGEFPDGDESSVATQEINSQYSFSRSSSVTSLRNVSHGRSSTSGVTPADPSSTRGGLTDLSSNMSTSGTFLSWEESVAHQLRIDGTPEDHLFGATCADHARGCAAALSDNSHVARATLTADNIHKIIGNQQHKLVDRM